MIYNRPPVAIADVLHVVQLSFAIFEPTCAHARWAHMCHFLSVRPPVCLSVRKNHTGQKVTGQKFICETMTKSEVRLQYSVQ